jgi:spore maturation protein B
VRHDRRRHGLEAPETLLAETAGGAVVITLKKILDDISIWTIPVLLVGIPLIGMIRGIKVYDAFIDGAKEGFNVAVRIIPFLVGILVAIGMFRGSGAMDMLTRALTPLLQSTGFPVEIFPLVILRTLSGSGSLALATDIIKRYGADSVIARTAATIYGGSETTFYVIAVYFGAIGVKRTRHAIPSALIGDVVAAIVAVAVCSWLF